MKRTSTHLTAFCIMAFALTVTFCFPAHAGYPRNPWHMTTDSWRLSHRTDFCNKALVVTPCLTANSGYVPVAYILSISHDIPATVSPNEVVNATIDWDLGDPPGSPVIYNDVFVDWDPDNSLAGINYVYSSPTSKTMSFSFTAPTRKGTYRLRWMHASWYRPVTSFFCGSDGCYETLADPDHTASPNAWMEVLIKVQ